MLQHVLCNMSADLLHMCCASSRLCVSVSCLWSVYCRRESLSVAGFTSSSECEGLTPLLPLHQSNMLICAHIFRCTHSIWIVSCCNDARSHTCSTACPHLVPLAVLTRVVYDAVLRPSSCASQVGSTSHTCQPSAMYPATLPLLRHTWIYPWWRPSLLVTLPPCSQAVAAAESFIQQQGLSDVQVEVETRTQDELQQVRAHVCVQAECSCTAVNCTWNALSCPAACCPAG